MPNAEPDERTLYRQEDLLGDAFVEQAPGLEQQLCAFVELGGGIDDIIRSLAGRPTVAARFTPTSENPLSTKFAEFALYEVG